MKTFTTKSPKVFAATSATLLVALCLLAVVVIAKRHIGPRQSVESAKLRLKSLVVRGTQLREAGQYEEAEPLLQEAVGVAEDTFGPDSFETANALNELGVLGKYDGRFERSEAAYRRALRIVDQTSGLDSELGATLEHVRVGGDDRLRHHPA